MRCLVCCAVLLAACDAWSLSINSDGFIHITVVGGDTHRPRDGYRIRVTRSATDSYVVSLPESGELRLERVPGQSVTLALVAPDGCRVAEPAAVVSAGTGSPQRATFALACRPAGG